MNENERIFLDRDLLQSFLEIAHRGKLTLAADRLGRTQSAISVQLRKLEEGLGVSLFTRSAKGMELTADGELLLPRAKAILANLRETAHLFKKPLTGVVRLGFPDDFDDIILEKILRQFARSHPGVRVNAMSGCTSRYPAAVKDGSLDLAVCSGPEKQNGIYLGHERTIWAASHDMHLEKGKPVPVAVLDRNCWWRDLPTKALEAAGMPYEIAFRSSSFASLQSALRAGFAIGILQQSGLVSELKPLNQRHGFPELPLTHRTILVSDTVAKPLSEAMIEAIRHAHQSVH